MHIIARSCMVFLLLLLLLLIVPAASQAEITVPSYDLTVDFDLAKHVLKGIARISAPGGESVMVHTEGLRIVSASVNEHALIIEPEMPTLNFSPGTGQDVLTIVYTVEASAVPAEDAGQGPGFVNMIGPDGIFLAGGWYPLLDRDAGFRLTAILPEGLEGISEAEDVMIEQIAGNQRRASFVFGHPLKKIHFIAGRYHSEMARHAGTEISAYVLPENRGQAQSALAAAGKIIDIYEQRIGKYPFRRLVLAESLFPSGLSVPTVVLSGKDTLKDPLLLEKVLTPGILYQWFGALVADEKGNWSRALASYLAEHGAGELKGAGEAFRKEILISYQNYVDSGNDFPVSSLDNKADRISRTIGSGKSALVFHMLRRLVTDDVFYRALRTFADEKRYSTATWDDMRKVFESVSGRELGWFFAQWLEGKGALDIEIRNLQLVYRGSTAVITFDAVQKTGPYRAVLPAVLKMREGEEQRFCEVEKETTSCEITAEGVPVEMVIDEHYDLFRKMTEDELPPTVARLLGSGKKIYVLPEKEGDCGEMSDLLSREGFVMKKGPEVTYDEMKTSSLLVSGKDALLAKRTLGKIEPPEGEFSLVVRENPYNKDEVIAVLGGGCSPDAAAFFAGISRYEQYSRLAFANGRNTLKGVDPRDQGIGFLLTEDVAGIEVPRLTRISGIIDKERQKKIIYVGEGHDRLEHHRVQLDVIRELHRRNPSVAIGMEMFQKPFQNVLDEYIAGTIDEKEFLKKSEYFKRWGFDFHLYREILLYAREFKLPVIALNITRETVTKVAREGIHALSEEEQKNLPEYVDLSDEDYRRRLRRFFERHQKPDDRNFDFFYQAQVLWDESMAQNLNEFMVKNPDRQVVVIAGVGHMAFGSGIPRRAFRLNGQPYTIILNGDDIEENVADYVLYPTPLKAVESPKLMIQFREEDGKSVISGFPADSISEKAGLQTDDIILSLDGTPVGGIDDIKIFLLYKKKGDSVTVRVSRKRFLFGPQEREFILKF